MDDNPIHINLTYDSLIALLQGKEFHLKSHDLHVVFHPPFDGVFMTHEQLMDLRMGEQARTLNIIKTVLKYKEDHDI